VKSYEVAQKRMFSETYSMYVCQQAAFVVLSTMMREDDCMFSLQTY